MAAVKCANFSQCGHFVDNPGLKGEYCSLQCRAAVHSRAPQLPVQPEVPQTPKSVSAVDTRVTKPAQGVVTKGAEKD